VSEEKQGSAGTQALLLAIHLLPISQQCPLDTHWVLRVGYAGNDGWQQGAFGFVDIPPGNVQIIFSHLLLSLTHISSCSQQWKSVH
jgi:hypothetical protein